jgi:hypothetical protein
MHPPSLLVPGSPFAGDRTTTPTWIRPSARFCHHRGRASPGNVGRSLQLCCRPRRTQVAAAFSAGPLRDREHEGQHATRRWGRWPLVRPSAGLQREVKDAGKESPIASPRTARARARRGPARPAWRREAALRREDSRSPAPDAASPSTKATRPDTPARLALARAATSTRPSRSEPMIGLTTAGSAGSLHTDCHRAAS